MTVTVIQQKTSACGKCLILIMRIPPTVTALSWTLTDKHFAVCTYPFQWPNIPCWSSMLMAKDLPSIAFEISRTFWTALKIYIQSALVFDDFISSWAWWRPQLAFRYDFGFASTICLPTSRIFVSGQRRMENALWKQIAQKLACFLPLHHLFINQKQGHESYVLKLMWIHTHNWRLLLLYLLRHQL